MAAAAARPGPETRPSPSVRVVAVPADSSGPPPRPLFCSGYVMALHISENNNIVGFIHFLMYKFVAMYRYFYVAVRCDAMVEAASRLPRYTFLRLSIRIKCLSIILGILELARWLCDACFIAFHFRASI